MLKPLLPRLPQPVIHGDCEGMTQEASSDDDARPRPTERLLKFNSLDELEYSARAPSSPPRSLHLGPICGLDSHSECGDWSAPADSGEDAPPFDGAFQDTQQRASQGPPSCAEGAPHELWEMRC